MKTVAVLILIGLVPLINSINLQEDDLVFDDVGEEASQSSVIINTTYHDTTNDDNRNSNIIINNNNTHESIEKFWGVSDAVATVGHVFKLKIPKQAFSGSVDHYEVRCKDDKPLPNWLYFDEAASTFMGVPSKKDVGLYHINVRAYGNSGDIANCVFNIKVIAEKFNRVKHKDGKSHCDDSEEQTLMTILLDAKFDDLKPITKVEAIENLAGFLGLHNSAFSMHGRGNKEESAAEDSTVILTGPGNVKHRKEKHSTCIQWQVGCDGHLWRHQANLLKQMKQQARDGTLYEVIQLPVLLWRVKTDSSDLLRNRREAGSGDYGNNGNNDEDYDDGNYDYDSSYYDGEGDGDRDNDGDDGEPQTELPPNSTVPSATLPRGKTESEQEHPHRHHHGEGTIESKAEENISEADIVPIINNKPERTLNTSTSIIPQLSIDATDILTTTQVPTTSILSTTTTPTSSHHVPIIETSSTASSTHISSVIPNVNLNVTPPTKMTTTTTSTSTSTSTTTTTPSTTTEKIIQRITTSSVVHAVPNRPPTRDRQLQKIPVTAGKPLSYIIPANTFSDAEDGNTRNLSLNVFHSRNHLDKTHWLQFNNETQEVYGLPLEKDISIWDYDLVASDRQGLNVDDKLKIYVQQHKLSRSITHEFSIHIQIDKHSVFPTNVDWELKVIRNLAQLYGDNDANHITVLSILINNDEVVFKWTNDSVQRSSECPQDEINKLLHVLIANHDGDPSAMLQDVLAPEIRVRHVEFRGKHQCEKMNGPISSKIPPHEPKPNFPPLPRNQVDHINATVGQLLVFHVPEDTFFDPEDGSARNMQMSLLTINRDAISPNDWLQFDVKNQEFYGVPMKNDVKRKEYQLIVTDKDGASATDGLVVVVHPINDTKSSAEFTIKLGIDYITFSESAMLKKNFINRLRDLFGDKNTNAISITSILPSGKNTIITWRNTTLPTDYCPNNEITRLSEVLFVKPDNKELTNRIERIMGSEFPVDQLTLTPMGICQGEFTRVHSIDNGISTSDDSTSVGGASNDDYLITFVLPAIIIAAMLIFAGIIACVLYRRKRRGKMSVSEHDDERQSFRSKGIPVIFQDELEEKPDPGNKSPVILKEEKPPLPPPEYQKGAEDGADQPMLPKENSEEPYQPPPPFARPSDNNRQNRPKPTPTYRKPPPYVPP